ncbi:hypothetical protein MFLAVUS_010222 [Mucor flavus]|uniref:Integrator complex subunit 7 n=1 Tax=Mucor flavus TaxID=439312 RepID=A0ABP9ZC41_9FUNG
MDEFNSSVARDQTEGHKVLLELEAKFNKKSRSAALSIQGSQIQALTGFIRIFEQYPYPVVINAAILKLADWFRTYNNNVKYYVYKVFKEASDLHLAKVINVEETVRRILPILGSNDTIARSITLRVLGCMSMIIAEKLDVQFGHVLTLVASIIQRLELATDRIELEAAIWAGDQICARSNRFPSVIFSKVGDKLEKPDTPFDIKLRLVKIFRHMHQDIGMARQAKLACLNLLNDPDTDPKLVIVTLRTLTLLLSEAVIDRKEQINRLLNYALKDTREEVRYNVLYDLFLLGKNDIMFDETHIVRLLNVIVSEPNLRTQQRGFKCAQNLIETHQKLIVQIITTTNSPILQEFTGLIHKCEKVMDASIENKQYTLLIACARLLYTVLRVILSSKINQDAMDIDISILPSMKELGYRIAERITKVDVVFIHSKEDNKYKLKELLKIKASFCLLLEEWDCDASFRDAYQLLTHADDEIAVVLLPYLSCISRRCLNLSSWFPDQAFKELQKRTNRPSICVNLVRLLLRTTKSNHELTEKIVSLLNQFGSWDQSSKSYLRNGWNIYLIGMEAGSCGWYELMYITMSGLCKKVETEACLYWLKSLSSLANAEWTLSINQTVSNHGYTASVLNKYIKSLTQHNALQSLETVRTNQSWYIQLRMEILVAIQHTIMALDHPHLKKQSRLMQDCAIKFRKIAFRYDFIAQAQFGIDREMLEVIEYYKIFALICEHASRTFSGHNQMFFCVDPSLIPLINNSGTKQTKLTNQNVAIRMIQLYKGFIKTVTAWDELDHLDSVDRRKICVKDMKYILQTIMEQPLILPKSFFGNRKNITIQLTTEPMLSEKKPITLQTNQDLVIKFEGLVQGNQHEKSKYI